MSLLIRGARVVDPGASAGAGRLGDVRVDGDRIVAVEDPGAGDRADEVIEADGRVLLPGFVDAHTHALWAGSRADELERRRRGESYLAILSSGGGIHATVRAVRVASEAELTERLTRRLAVMLREGTTTVEVKSGYGLTTADELKMLRAIHAAAAGFPGTVVATALLGHAVDPATPRFIDVVIEETLPAVHAAFPGIEIDAFCEEGAWSLADCRRLLVAARALGHPVRLHADQFHRLGGVALAIELQARSVDHLEASLPEDLLALGRAGLFGVMLPATAFHLDGAYANGRAFLDAGGRLVLATNCNPGSSPTSSIPFVVALAVRRLGLSIAEAIRAVTATAAERLGFGDRGRIAVGQRADLVLLRHTDEQLLGYELGGNPVDVVVCSGRVIAGQR